MRANARPPATVACANSATWHTTHCWTGALDLDMVRLALDPDAKIDLNYRYWATLLERIAAPYFSGLGMVPGRLAELAAGVDEAQRVAVFLCIRYGTGIRPIYGLRSPLLLQQVNGAACGSSCGRSYAPSGSPTNERHGDMILPDPPTPGLINSVSPTLYETLLSCPARAAWLTNGRRTRWYSTLRLFSEHASTL